MTRSVSRSDESRIALGIALPQYGTMASPETILRVAVEAEKMGLASLWVSDRMLLPTKPKDTFDGDPWPEIFATVYDPIEMLTFVAGRTRKAKLGTSVMSALFHNPVTLARRFATLDRLSMEEQLPASARATLETSSKLPTSRQKGVEEDSKNLLTQCAPSGARTQSASLETSTISQNQESDRNPYSLAAFQCY